MSTLSILRDVFGLRLLLWYHWQTYQVPGSELCFEVHACFAPGTRGQQSRCTVRLAGRGTWQIWHRGDAIMPAAASHMRGRRYSYYCKSTRYLSTVVCLSTWLSLEVMVVIIMVIITWTARRCTASRTMPGPGLVNCRSGWDTWEQ